jgi:hypothetical protein
LSDPVSRSLGKESSTQRQSKALEIEPPLYRLTIPTRKLERDPSQPVHPGEHGALALLEIESAPPIHLADGIPTPANARLARRATRMLECW